MFQRKPSKNVHAWLPGTLTVLAFFVGGMVAWFFKLEGVRWALLALAGGAITTAELLRFKLIVAFILLTLVLIILKKGIVLLSFFIGLFTFQIILIIASNYWINMAVENFEGVANISLLMFAIIGILGAILWMVHNSSKTKVETYREEHHYGGGGH